MEEHEVLIIGSGPAGMAAAVRLRESGIEDILIIEREKQRGGILRQCVHDGFGLTRFGVSLAGPEYSQRFIDRIDELGIPYVADATVIDLSSDRVATVATRSGLRQYRGKAVILAMGCRERTRGALAIPGTRPSGIYNAGVAQSYVNLHNTMVGKEIVILGSGDIGLIMARRLTLEGAHVKAVYEIQQYPSGLPRNIEQCLNDYNIPLYLGRSVIDIKGSERIEGVTVADYDANMRPIPGTEEYVSCDTLVLSVGLIPENELSLAAGVSLDRRTNGAEVDEFCQTTVPGIFSAGNVLHVHDLADFVSQEAERTADAVSEYLREGSLPESRIKVCASSAIGHVIPQRISGERDFHLSFRVWKPMGRCTVEIRQGETLIKKVPLMKALPTDMVHIEVPCENIVPGRDLEVTVNE